MRTWTKNVAAASLAGLMALTGAPCLHAQTTKASDKQTNELKRITQKMADAVAIGDKETWDRYTDANLVYVDENNVVKDKKTLLQELVPLPEGFFGRIAVTEYSARYFPGGAVATYIMEESEIVEGQAIHARYRETDTWVRSGIGRGANWRIIASQVLAIPKDPPAIFLPAQTLDQYLGRYALSDKTQVEIRREGDHLVASRANAKPRVMLAEAPDVFFTPGSPRERRIFTRAGDGGVNGFRARREGEDLVWKRISE